MSKLPSINQTFKDEHDNGQPNTKRVSLYGWDSDGSQKTRLTASAEGELNVAATSLPLPTGASTSAKQLPNDHDVTVSNIASTPVISGFATSDKQDTLLTELQLKADLTETQPVTIVGLTLNDDGSINVIPNGSIVDEDNSTLTPLLPNATFTGAAVEILHFAAIAILVYSDVASATDGMSVEFSVNGTDWHGGESYTISAGATKFFTPPAQSKYYRIVYINGPINQTTFHLHSILKKSPIKWSSHNIDDPIKDQDDAELIKAVITGKRTDGTYDNVSLTNGANMKVSLEELESTISSNSNTQLNTTLFDVSGNAFDSHESGGGGYHLGVNATITGDQNVNRHAWLNALGDQVVSPRYRLIGHSFSGTTKDTNFWGETVTNGGTVSQAGGVVDLDTNTNGTGGNGTAMYYSLRKARFVAGSPMVFTALVNWETAGTVNNLRRVGAYNDDNGFFCQLNGTTFSLGTRKGGVDTLYTTFNGNMGSTFTPTADTDYKVNIEFLPVGVFWYISGVLLHKIGAGHLSDTLTLPVRIENINSLTLDDDINFHTHAMLIERQGQASTSPTSKYISGQSVTVCKYGAGTLKGIVISAIVNGADVNIYDGTAITDPLIWASGNQGARTEPLNIDFFGLPYNDGLTLEIVDQDADVLIVYE